ncbi:MAG: hypothetical protein D6712_17820 [Chloroflexi bacterium]|nr:MAG: hypothetical protein D6712_17820 [Chloroflexota bacterium]
MSVELEKKIQTIELKLDYLEKSVSTQLAQLAEIMKQGFLMLVLTAISVVAIPILGYLFLQGLIDKLFFGVALLVVAGALGFGRGIDHVAQLIRVWKYGNGHH